MKKKWLVVAAVVVLVAGLGFADGVPLVGWARVYRRRHTWAQVVVGGLVGAAVTTAVLAAVLR
ncbi:MAG: hypothetical protein DRI80_16820 [Chloroflexota bacterium]|nr:MAG: hypothetical protein DRI80_16820 [Chloroflexota bacterium]